MLENFKPHITNYFNLIRRNTDWLQETLSKSFEYIGQTVEHINHSPGFCVVNTIPNLDANTVYVGLDFSPLFKNPYISKEINVKKTRKTLLKLAKHHNLPLTGRQSFGFSLSNLTPIGSERLRFSIGLEDPETLEKYVELLRNFAFLLTLYLAETNIQFNYDTFEEHLLDVIKIIKKEKPLPGLYCISGRSRR